MMTPSQCKIALQNLQFLKVPDAATILGLDVRSLRRAIEAGQIPATKVGAQTLIPTAWLRQQAMIDS
jgi:excisionase family DNA binding protein